MIGSGEWIGRRPERDRRAPRNPRWPDQGRFANIDNLLSQCSRFLLDYDLAVSIIREMEECIRQNWYTLFRSEGVSGTDCEKISSAFVYTGFNKKYSL